MSSDKFEVKFGRKTRFKFAYNTPVTDLLLIMKTTRRSLIKNNHDLSVNLKNNK